MLESVINAQQDHRAVQNNMFPVSTTEATSPADPCLHYGQLLRSTALALLLPPRHQQLRIAGLAAHGTEFWQAPNLGHSTDWQHRASRPDHEPRVAHWQAKVGYNAT